MVDYIVNIFGLKTEARFQFIGVNMGALFDVFTDRGKDILTLTVVDHASADMTAAFKYS